MLSFVWLLFCARVRKVAAFLKPTLLRGQDSRAQVSDRQRRRAREQEQAKVLE